MPTYTYRCADCNHTFDMVQRITEDPVKVCASCGAEAASRLITSGNFMLKGSGWYSDLYSGSSNKKSASADSSSSTSSSSDAGGTCAKTGSGCDGAGACAAPATTTSSTTPSSN